MSTICTHLVRIAADYKPPQGYELPLPSRSGCPENHLVLDSNRNPSEGCLFPFSILGFAVNG